MPAETATPRRRLVLVGGGHAHVVVLKHFAARPEPTLDVTLVTPAPTSAYSGMLPGVIAGLYPPAAAQIDVAALAAAAGATFVADSVTGIDAGARRLALSGGGTLAYDLVSLDVGIVPELGSIAGAAAHALPVKPVNEWLARFDELRARCRDPDGPRRIVMIGGGAAGVEVLLATRHRLLAEAAPADRPRYSFALVTGGALLSGHAAPVQQRFRRHCAARGVEVHEDMAVHEVAADAVALDDGRRLAADVVLAATAAAAPPWFAGSGLALDRRGFLAVGPTLQSKSHAEVFGAGDCITLVEAPREKAGVYAVRAGKPLAENLRRFARGAPPRAWRPQARHLALISTGEAYAVASRGFLTVEGGWVWRLKDWIDRRWMRWCDVTAKT